MVYSISDHGSGAGPSSGGGRNYEGNSRSGFDNRSSGSSNNYGGGGPNVPKSDSSREHRQHGPRDSVEFSRESAEVRGKLVEVSTQ